MAGSGTPFILGGGWFDAISSLRRFPAVDEFFAVMMLIKNILQLVSSKIGISLLDYP